MPSLTMQEAIQRLVLAWVFEGANGEGEDRPSLPQLARVVADGLVYFDPDENPAYTLTGKGMGRFAVLQNANRAAS